MAATPTFPTPFSPSSLQVIYRVSAPWFYLGWVIITVCVVVALISFMFAVFVLGRAVIEKLFGPTETVSPSQFVLMNNRSLPSPTFPASLF